MNSVASGDNRIAGAATNTTLKSSTNSEEESDG
jgi:hypothetical protein